MTMYINVMLRRVKLDHQLLLARLFSHFSFYRFFFAERFSIFTLCENSRLGKLLTGGLITRDEERPELPNPMVCSVLMIKS